MPTATKFWLLFPAIVLLALSVWLYLRWPFRVDSSESAPPDDDGTKDGLRPISPLGKKPR